MQKSELLSLLGLVEAKIKTFDDVIKHHEMCKKGVFSVYHLVSKQQLDEAERGLIWWNQIKEGLLQEIEKVGDTVAYRETAQAAQSEESNPYNFYIYL